MYGPFRTAGQLIALTLALPFLILALPVLLTWACARLCDTGFQSNQAAGRTPSAMCRPNSARDNASLTTLRYNDGGLISCLD